MEALPEKKCKCMGIRYCNFCKDPDVRKHFKDLYPLEDTTSIQTYNVLPTDLFKCSSSNGEILSLDEILDFSGFHVFSDFITEEMENHVVTQLQQSGKWVESQSGRKKIDFGPQANFKKQKIKEGHFKGLPECMKPVIEKIHSQIGSGLVKDDMGTDISEKVKNFEEVEMNVLEYDSERGSNIAPHMDDLWLWGERIFGLNLLSETSMTFTKDNMEVVFPVKRRQLYLISGKSRLEWMHGIKQEHITGKRMVCKRVKQE
ncbi:hypothetical protein FGO68_gene16757 [Halteria grandinella]|uniref:Fe2OG dioxygenase domain-containing protein n=1 Tax=Halteria grandinella TaxID=5974 RepID=A0A8J8NJL1_HALGN|nr:hypothetical protein FGO68_gene16757 [Halteria grandinella]